MCVIPSVKSTNFAKIVENFAQILDKQNWEKKTRDVLGNAKKKKGG